MKTLKDHELWTAPNTNRSLSVEVLKLRQSIIDDIKEMPYIEPKSILDLDVDAKENISYSMSYIREAEQMKPVRFYLMRKFNITKDDLI